MLLWQRHDENNMNDAGSCEAFGTPRGCHRILLPLNLHTRLRRSKASKSNGPSSHCRDTDLAHRLLDEYPIEMELYIGVVIFEVFIITSHRAFADIFTSSLWAVTSSSPATSLPVPTT